MRKASAQDIPLLIEMMDEFYAEAGYELNRGHAAEAFAALIADDSRGLVWIVESPAESAGYLVLTLKFSMEYGGLTACLDDLYVRAAYRNRGLSTSALAEMREFCRGIGARAVSVEVGRDNGPAQTVYRRAGFVETDRQLLTLALDDPVHLT